jgi:hypothetical protein
MGLYKPTPNLNSRATELLIKLKGLLKDDLKEEELSKITALMETYLAKSSSYVELDDMSLVDRPELIMPKFTVCNDQTLPPPPVGLNYFWDGEFADEGERHLAGLSIEGVLSDHDKPWVGMRSRLDTGRMKMRWSSAARRDEITNAGYIYVGPMHDAVAMWGVNDSENNSLYDTRALMTLLQTAVLAIHHPRVGTRPGNILEFVRQCGFWLEQRRLWPHELQLKMNRSRYGSYSTRHCLQVYALMRLSGFGIPHGNTILLAEISWDQAERSLPSPETGILIEMPERLLYLKDMFHTDQWKNTTIKEFESQK